MGKSKCMNCFCFYKTVYCLTVCSDSVHDHGERLETKMKEDKYIWYRKSYTPIFSLPIHPTADGHASYGIRYAHDDAGSMGLHGLSAVYGHSLHVLGSFRVSGFIMRKKKQNTKKIWHSLLNSIGGWGNQSNGVLMVAVDVSLHNILETLPCFQNDVPQLPHDALRWRRPYNEPDVHVHGETKIRSSLEWRSQ